MRNRNNERIDQRKKERKNERKISTKEDDVTDKSKGQERNVRK
jgi:hypothetical protein